MSSLLLLAFLGPDVDADLRSAIRKMHADVRDLWTHYEGVRTPGPDVPESAREEYTALAGYHQDGIFYREVFGNRRPTMVRTFKAVQRGVGTRRKVLGPEQRKAMQSRYWENTREEFSFGWFYAPVIFRFMPDDVADTLRTIGKEGLGKHDCTVVVAKRHDHVGWLWRFWIDFELDASVVKWRQEIDGKVVYETKVSRFVTVADPGGRNFHVPSDGEWSSYVVFDRNQKTRELTVSKQRRQYWTFHLLQETCEINSGADASDFIGQSGAQLKIGAPMGPVAAVDPSDLLTRDNPSKGDVRRTLDEAKSQENPAKHSRSWLQLIAIGAAVAGACAILSALVARMRQRLIRPR